MDGAAREELSHIRDRLNLWEEEIRNDSLISISPIQNKIFNFVRTIDKEAKEEHWIREIGTYVDIYAPSTNCVFQVDGKNHFYANDNVQDAATRFNTAMVSQYAILSRITNFHDYERDIKITLKEARTTQYKAVETEKQTDNTFISSNPFSSLDVEEIGDIVETLQSASVSISAPKTSKKELRKKSKERKKLLESDEKEVINPVIQEKSQGLSEIEREEERAKLLNTSLVEKYIAKNAAKLTNKTPLMLAVEERSAQWIKMILQEGFSSQEAKEALDIAIRNNDLPVIQEFLSYDIPIGSRSNRDIICNSLAISAIEVGYPKILQSLIARKLVDPNFKRVDGLTPLTLACERNNVEAVEILLNAGANPNKLRQGYSPLYIACESASPQVAQILLKNGAKPNVAVPDMSTPLLSVCRKNDKETIRLLLKLGANPNVVDNFGQSVLLLAARDGNAELVDAIIEAGKVSVDIISREADRVTPLMAATQNKHMDIVESLVNAGAQMEIKNRLGQTALLIAAQNGTRQAVRMFLNKFADPDISFKQDKMKVNPLIISTDNGHVDIVKDLLAAGANINAGSPNSAKARAEYFSKEGGASLIIFQELKKFERDPVKYIVEYDQPIELKLKALDRLSEQGVTPEVTAEINRHKELLEHVSQAQINMNLTSSNRFIPSSQAKASGKSMGR